MVDAVGTTHHVKINGQHFLVRPGSYRKRPAPLFGPRFTTGDPDYNNLSMWQHWVQRCWVGGFGAETWRDDAMFHEGVGIDGRQHEVMVLARDLGPNGATRTTANWALGNGANPTETFQSRKFITYAGKLYCLEPNDAGNNSFLWRFNYATSDWTLVRTFGVFGVAMEYFTGVLWFGLEGTDLQYMDGSETFYNFPKPGGVTDVVYAMSVYKSRMYVDFRGKIWRIKTDPATGATSWDGSTVFFETDGDPRYAVTMAVHLGFLYIGTINGRIYRTDGNQTHELWDFDGVVSIIDMASYDGRLFVSCQEATDGTSGAEAVLYQFSGAAVTELKRWGRLGQKINTGKLRVIGHQLMFGAGSLLGMGTGFGVASYDPREDAYHLVASNRDGVNYPDFSGFRISHLVSDIYFFAGWVFCAVVGYGVFRFALSHQDVSRFAAFYDTTASGETLASQNGGWFASSDFDAGTPGLMKMWNAITIEVDLPTNETGLYVEYSLDGGINWVGVGSVTTSIPTGERIRRSLVLGDGVTPVRGPRFKYRITLRTVNSARTPQLRGVIVRYLPVPEPNWMWEFTLELSESQELLDGTVQEPNNVTKINALRTPFRTQALVHFQDRDLTEYAGAGKPGVLIYSLEESVPVPGPISDGPIETEVRVVLLEAIEAYP